MINNDKKLTTPLARALASEKGIDISNIEGSGFNGRVLVSDILNFTGSPKKQVSVSNKEDVRVKVSGMRKAIASAMKNSWSNVAYTNLVVEINATKLWDARKTLTTEKNIAKYGTKPTFLSFIMRATTIALKEFPMLNAKYDQATDEIIQYGSINLGIAVDTHSGLVVPVINGTEDKSIIDMSKEIVTIAKKAREKKLTSSDMSGGTFTITNYGSVGALYGVPVINFPEIAILGTGAIQDKVYCDEHENFYHGKVMHLTLAADHRWVDGADMGRFLSRIKELLEEPFLLGGIDV